MPPKGNWLYCPYFCILCNKNGIKGLWEHKGRPSLGLGPTLVLQWTLPWPVIHLTWPFLFWLYFCILCKKNGIKGLWAHKGLPSLGLGPAWVLQWTLPWPYNTSDMALQYTWHGPLYIGYIFAFYTRPYGGQPVCSQSPLLQYSLHRMQKYSQYIRGHVGCIVGQW